jgi:hypothetical protein
VAIVKNPAIKGTLFAGVVEDLGQAIAGGRLSHDAVATALSADEIELLDSKINAAGWYDLDTYHRMVGLLCDAEGGGHDSYWHERGLRAARRMADAGIYQQLDYIGRTQARRESVPEARFKALAKDLRLLLSVHSAMLNFGEWKTVVDPDHGDRYRVEIRGVAGIPDGIFVATAGMFNGISELASASNQRTWRYERAEPDLAVIRMLTPA